MSLRESLLQEILGQPSAPYRERQVINVITHALDAGGVPYFSDPVGNLILGVTSQKEYFQHIRASSRASDGPIRIFVAHMDHPGFHGSSWKSPTELEIKWHGGSPTQHLEGARVWLANDAGWIDAQGQMTQAELEAHGLAIKQAVVRVPEGLRTANPDATRVFGGFAFREPSWRDGELIYTKAADDLVGAFAIVSLALDLFAKKKKKSARPPFLGILTRAEEVGFIGLIGHLELGWLKKAKRELLFVSLETSRMFPGAEIGKGPVVRLGDKFTVFDAGGLRLFADLAKEVLPTGHQRRIMEGGTCEASAAIVYGFRAIGMSVPLGNYHNQSIEGGPDAAPTQGPAPEFVHIKDVEGLLTLCHGLLKKRLPWHAPWVEKHKTLKKSLRDARALLRSGP